VEQSQLLFLLYKIQKTLMLIIVKNITFQQM